MGNIGSNHTESSSNTTQPGIKSLIWMGIRTEKFAETVKFYRDVMNLKIIHSGTDTVWFELENGVEFHVYGPTDEDHAFFGIGPVVGFEVEDFDRTQSRMINAGIAFIGPVQRQNGRTWNHFRGPDGNIYEIMSRETDNK